jgi:adenine phosphoribosyltransferase
VLDHFRWEGGRADIWRLFADADAFRLVIDGLVQPWRSASVTRVVGVESRGFLLGGACAVALGVGFVAVRKDAGLLPGPKATVQAGQDYRGNHHRLCMQRILDPADRVLFVDDWAERGSQATHHRSLSRQAMPRSWRDGRSGRSTNDHLAVIGARWPPRPCA